MLGEEIDGINTFGEIKQHALTDGNNADIESLCEIDGNNTLGEIKQHALTDGSSTLGENNQFRLLGCDIDEKDLERLRKINDRSFCLENMSGDVSKIVSENPTSFKLIGATVHFGDAADKIRSLSPTMLGQVFKFLNNRFNASDEFKTHFCCSKGGFMLTKKSTKGC
jgi:hypothetical protein